MSAQNFSNLINGKWVGSNDYKANINPSDTRDVVGNYAQGTKEDASNAFAAASEAFPKWSHSTPQQRFDLLDAAGTEILKRRDELGNLLATS
jgi:aldehyde dehydrogenase (NAD+)